MTDEEKTKANAAFCRDSPAPIGLDGKPMKTSVCDAIEESMINAAEIERQIANSKVIYSIAES